MDIQTGLRRPLSPQCQIILNHLRKAGNISGVEASALYRVRALPRRIKDLQEAGVAVAADRKVDLTGQRYVRYRLRGIAA